LGGVGVAIKVSQQAPGPEAEDQLWAAQYEAMVASDLSHVNLVRTIDWCCHYEGGVMWIVQELCDKGSLAIAIKQGALRVEQGNVKSDPDMHAVLETAADVARGMQYLHAHDVIHGDLSSNNVVFISSEEDSRKLGFTAKISDLGLSRALGGDCATKTVGTISHMPPELLTSGVMAKGGDVYSFGVMLWELYTGKRAWSGCSQAQVIFAITCKKAGLELPSDAPAGYAALAMQCMDRERVNRPKFGEIVARLEELLEELS
jgi:serine/threonine protein kinase